MLVYQRLPHIYIYIYIHIIFSVFIYGDNRWLMDSDPHAKYYANAKRIMTQGP